MIYPHSLILSAITGVTGVVRENHLQFGTMSRCDVSRVLLQTAISPRRKSYLLKLPGLLKIRCDHVHSGCLHDRPSNS